MYWGLEDQYSSPLFRGCTVPSPNNDTRDIAVVNTNMIKIKININFSVHFIEITYIYFVNNFVC